MHNESIDQMFPAFSETVLPRFVFVVCPDQYNKLQKIYLFCYYLASHISTCIVFGSMLMPGAPTFNYQLQLQTNQHLEYFLKPK